MRTGAVPLPARGRAVAGHGRALPGHAVVSGPRLRGRPCARAVAGAAQVGHTRVGGVDLNKPRLRAVVAAVLALAVRPEGFRVADVVPQVHTRAPALAGTYGPRQAAYDLKKLRAKGLLEKVDRARRYRLPPAGVRTLAALLVLREHVIKPLLAGTAKPKMGRKPKTWTRVDAHYEALRKEMHALFDDLGLAAA